MRIGNAQDANGRKYITGISAVENGSAIASDIISIRNGSGISLSSSVDGTLVVDAVFNPLVESISSKVEKPFSGDVSGLVLATNGDGTTRWVENGGESVPWSKLSSKPATINAMPSSVGSNGQLLVADSNGYMVWKTPDSAITSDSRNPPTASAVNAAIRVHVNANGMHLPFADATSRGKVLKVDNVGNPTWATDLTLEGSAVLPGYDSHDALKVLRVTSDGNGTEWSVNKGAEVTVEHSLVSGSNPVAGSAIYNAIQGRMPAIDPAGRAGNVVAVNNAGNGYALSSVVQSAVKATSATYAESALNVDMSIVSAHVSNVSMHVPTSGADNGMVLMMSGGVPAWKDAGVIVQESNVLPEYGATDSGKVLAVNDTGTGTLWKVNSATVAVADSVTQNGMNPPTASAVYQFVTMNVNPPSPTTTGDMTIASFVSPYGNGVVRSASYATSAVYINGHTVSKDVPSNAVFTDTVPGSGVLTINVDDSTIGTFNANASTNSTITIPKATSASYGLVKVETAIANTTNAVANAVVSAISSRMSMHVNSNVVHVPSATQANNGQVLKVEDGVPVWSTDLTGGGSAVLPSYGAVDANKVLKVNGNGDGTLWASDIAGSSIVVDSFISSDGANPVAGAVIHSALMSKMNVVLGGETGQVLTRTADGVEWGTVSASEGAPVQVSGVGISSIVAGSNIIMNVENGVLYLSAVATAHSSDIGNKVDYEDLAQVAFTGDYNDVVGRVIVDGELDSASTNPVENRVLWSSLESLSSQLGNVSSLLEEL
jgi:hypothetical protein